MSSADRAGRHRYVILALDDEPEIVEMLQRSLRGRFRCVGTTSSAQAEAAFEEEAFDVVIADQKMPDGGGVSFLARVAERSPLTRRIMLSGFAEIGDLLVAINQGKVSRYLLKPITPEALIEAVDTVLIEYERERTALQRLLFDRFGGAAADQARARRAPSDGRLRPTSWPFGPAVQRIEDDAGPLAALLEPGLEVTLGALRPDEPLEGEALVAWRAEVERRMVSMLRETDQAFRLPGGRFVVAFARTPLAGGRRACDRLGEGLAGGIVATILSWPGDPPVEDAVALARRALAAAQE